MPLFTVRVEQAGKVKILDVDAQTPHLAVKLAEVIVCGTAVDVTCTRTVVGRCGRCGAVLFDGDQDRGKKGAVWCRAC